MVTLLGFYINVEIRAHFPDRTLIAGNITTAEGARALYDAGVDVVKVGIGPGSLVLLVWLRVPQVTVIYDAAAVRANMEKRLLLMVESSILEIL